MTNREFYAKMSNEALARRICISLSWCGDCPGQEECDLLNGTGEANGLEKWLKEDTEQ